MEFFLFHVSYFLMTFEVSQKSNYVADNEKSEREGEYCITVIACIESLIDFIVYSYAQFSFIMFKNWF